MEIKYIEPNQIAEEMRRKVDGGKNKQFMFIY